MITAAITAIADAIGKIFNCRTSAIEHQSETELTRQFRNAAKAIDVAEQIIFLVDRYDKIEKDTFDRVYQKLRKRFFKYN